MPPKALNILIFSVIVYFMTGLKREVGPFFLFVVFTYVTTLTMTAWFRLLVGLVNTIELAFVIAGLSVLPLAIYGGYAIPRPSMHPWFKWISYISPIFYTVEALMAVEFHGREAPCQSLVLSGSGYEDVSVVNQACAVVGAKLGNSFVLGDDYIDIPFGYQYSHVWRNLGICFVFFVAFTFLYAFTIEFMKLDDATSNHMVFRKPTPSQSNDREKASEQTLELQPNQDVFCWKHVNYDIQIKGENRRLLQDVQGYVEPGKLTALMGASGAVSGNITVNGVPLSGDFTRRTGYCMQQDIHMEEMTVREALQFSAMLRQPEDTPASHKLAYVEKIISLLKVDEYADAPRKRTTIGLEFVARPSLLLFLDEPASGLDSQSAISIVQLLGDLSDAAQAILCTIHQPSSTLLAHFDRLLLLARGGVKREVLAYFEQYGAPPCPASSNPAEYFLEQVGAGASNRVTLDWPSIWNTSSERPTVSSKIQQLESGKSQHAEERQDLHSPFAVSWFGQYKLVQKRLFVQHWRSPSYIHGTLFVNIVGGLLIAFTFYKESAMIQGLQNRMFSVFCILVLCLTLTFLLQPRLLALCNVYDVREKHSNMYHWSVFLVANIVVELPFNFIISTLCFICWFFPVGWWRDMSSGAAYHTTFAQAIAIVSPNPETAAMVTILFYTFILAFRGVLQPLSQLVKFWHFAYYVSPFTWLVSTFMTAGTHGVAVRCAPAEVTTFQPPEGRTCDEYAGAFANATMAVINNPEATQNCEFCSISVADAYLSSLNMDYGDRWRNIGFLTVYIVFNVLIFTAGLYLHSYPISLKKFGFKKRTGGS
ncbi:hypothetical protein BU23DRAFT_593783 [Bimuria novae-zelandiae CBS 107.79]|uniref:ABC transporter domain-containing protein n=1 Tax=Bimuria novae-zelandiae CBS 107.79 TaxID=1447943 RepID=A0A6A5UVX5_9PLEO|nr:hypothetical protein BU23DRAFT_593783 [Bimuria novae-zelandiae CBS 107.79]